MKSLQNVYLAGVLALSLQPWTQALADDPAAGSDPLELQQQILEQGPMLLGNLRQAQAEGLRRDADGMTYSLHEARRVLYAMLTANRMMDANTDASPVPLGQILELDRPESGGRDQSLARFELDSGSFLPQAVDDDITAALEALRQGTPASALPRSAALSRSPPVGSSLPQTSADRPSRRRVSWSLRSS